MIDFNTFALWWMIAMWIIGSLVATVGLLIVLIRLIKKLVQLVENDNGPL